MSIVDKELALITERAGGENWRLEAEPIITLARELEAHCEALTEYSAQHLYICHCAVCNYRQFKAERG